MLKRALRVILPACVLAASLAAASLARAADPVPAGDNSSGTVTVTAEHRTINLQKAPLAATVLSQTDLDKKSVDTVVALQFATPSLTYSDSGQGNEFNIRGIGKNNIEGNSISGIASYRDGIGTVAAFFAKEPYYDVSSVEVLRGPQGTFVGQNATGGAIFVNTRNPVLGGHLGGWIEGAYGNYNEFDLSGAVNLPINDTLAMRVAFDHTQHDTFYHITGGAPNSIGAPRENSLRLSLLWQPTSALQIVFKTDVNDLNYRGYAHSPIPGSLFGTAPFPTPSPNLFDVAMNANEGARDQEVRSLLDIHYTFGDGVVLRSLTGAQWITTFLHDDDDSTAVVSNTLNINAHIRLFSQEFTLVSPDTGKFRWILGAYYQQQTSVFPVKDGFIGVNALAGIVVRLPWKTPGTSEAVYGQATYELGDGFEVQAGLRYNDYRVSQIANLSLDFGFFVLPLPIRNSEHDDKLTGKLALNWTVNPNNFLYAFVATGHNGGGVNVVAGQPTFKPTDVTDYEIGWKATLFDGRLRTQLDGFYDQIRDYQVTFNDPTTPNEGGIHNLAGISVVDGVELSGQAVFGDLAFDFGAAYLHSQLGAAKSVSATGIAVGGGLPQCSPSLPAGTPCFDYTPFLVSLSGRIQPYTPSYTFNAGVQYTFHCPGNATLTPRADYGWVDRQLTTLFDNQNPVTGQFTDRLAARGIVNLQLTYERDDWRVTGYMTNAGDLVYASAHGGGNNAIYAGPPRQFGVRVYRKF